MNDDAQLIWEAYTSSEQPIHEGVGDYTIVKTGSHTEEFDEDEDAFESEVTYTTYDILKSGKKVGYLETESYFGYINGELFGKPLPELSNYGHGSMSGPLSHLHAFIKSKTGAKWASNLHKYAK